MRVAFGLPIACKQAIFKGHLARLGPFEGDHISCFFNFASQNGTG